MENARFEILLLPLRKFRGKRYFWKSEILLFARAWMSTFCEACVAKKSVSRKIRITSQKKL